jgi:hypothetical protein
MDEIVYSFSLPAERYVTYVKELLDKYDLSLWKDVRQKRNVLVECGCKICEVYMTVSGSKNIEEFIENMTGIRGLYFQELGILLMPADSKKGRL